MKNPISRVFEEIRAAWPYFLPAWLHALLLPILVSWLAVYFRQNENCCALLYQMSFVVWLFAVIPVRKRLVGVSHAILFILLPYVPLVVSSIAAMSE
jgi:hypothetical protein